MRPAEEQASSVMATSLADEAGKPKASPLRLMILTLSDATSHTNASETSREGNLSRPLPQCSSLPLFLEELTGSLPSAGVDSFAGYTSHPPLSLRNKYYAADVSLWCDELPLVNSPSEVSSIRETENPSLSEWKSQMLSEEAREVRAVIGGIILLLPQAPMPSGSTSLPTVKDFLPYVEAVNMFREAVEDDTGREVASILVLQDMSTSNAPTSSKPVGGDTLLEKLEDMCVSEHGLIGWDFVRWRRRGLASSAEVPSPVDREKAESADSEEKNIYGEKVGVPRVIEVLENVDWFAGPSADDDEIANILASEDDFYDENLFGDQPKNDYIPGVKPSIGGRTGFGKNVDHVTQQSHEFQREMMGLHFALEKQEQDSEKADSEDDGDALDDANWPNGHKAGSNADNEMKVEELTGLMERMVAIREAGSEMTKAQREQYARREVAKIMKELE